MQKLSLVGLVACAAAPAPVEPPKPPPPVEIHHEIGLRIDHRGCLFTDGKGYEDEDLRVPRGASVRLQISHEEADAPATVTVGTARVAVDNHASGALQFTAHAGSWSCNDVERAIVVMPPSELTAMIRAADELVTPTTVAGKVALGERLFQAKGCIVCHTNDGTPRFAPTWKGMWGTTVTSASGDTRTVDDAYIRESILAPQAFIVTGFPASMPSYAGLLNDLELESVARYIESLD